MILCCLMHRNVNVQTLYVCGLGTRSLICSPGLTGFHSHFTQICIYVVTVLLLIMLCYYWFSNYSRIYLVRVS